MPVDELTLSETEKELLKHIAKGYENKTIAELMNLSINTLEKHIKALYEKLEFDVGNVRVNAAVYALRNGLYE